ncbi:MAG: pyridoxamine 5'-phosphate oxidase [Reichenbachiella sp.]
MTRDELPSMRKDYGIDELSKKSVDKDPLIQFEKWFKDAMKTEGVEANAFTLSTIGADGIPEGRIVLLKYYAEDGFTFYTNYNSEKAIQIDKKPVGAMTFHWRTKERQVRVKGTISKVDSIISDEYFKERPVGSRIGAWASPQSKEIPDRAYLIKQAELIKAKFPEENQIPRPEFWGGYLIDPVKIEFWQGRPNRLHDRIVYEKIGKEWKTKRVAP